jgi:flotillin
VWGDGAAKCISGGGAFVWPVIQEYAYLSLEPIQIDIPLKDALSLENIRVAVPSVFTVAIGTEEAVRQNAAIRLMGLTHDQIKRQAQDIIFGQLRQVIASMRIEEINRDREGFLHRIQTSLEPELRKIGLVLINVNITDLKDDSGYIEAIGKKAAAMAVQQARGDVADQEKLGEVRVADAERDRAVQVANAQKIREIGMREAERDKLVRVAEVDKEQKIGEQKAAFERDAMIKDADRAPRGSIAENEAKAIDGEATSIALVAPAAPRCRCASRKPISCPRRRKREAEAAVQEAQNRAMARAAFATLDRVEAEQRANSRPPRSAAKKRRRSWKRRRPPRRCAHSAQAEAQSDLHQAGGRGAWQYEIMSKKADAMKELVAAAGGAKEAFQLMMVEHLDTLAETSAKAISNIKFDKVVVWDSGHGGKGGASGFLQSMARTMPPMMHVLRDIAGVELPGYVAKLSDAERPAAEPTASAATEPDVVRQEALTRSSGCGARGRAPQPPLREPTRALRCEPRATARESLATREGSLPRWLAAPDLGQFQRCAMRGGAPRRQARASALNGRRRADARRAARSRLAARRAVLASSGPAMPAGRRAGCPRSRPSRVARDSRAVARGSQRQARVGRRRGYPARRPTRRI